MFKKYYNKMSFIFLYIIFKETISKHKPFHCICTIFFNCIICWQHLYEDFIHVFKQSLIGQFNTTAVAGSIYILAKY